jgi:SSS family solute:Na+ symporter
MTDFVAISYALVIVVLAAVAIYALAYPSIIVPRFYSKESEAMQDLAGFLTAKKSQNRWRIGFSFYAGSVGAWAITTPANYASFAGWVGMVFYALACGLPLIVLAYLGNTVRDKYPSAGALGDIITMRFGPFMRYCVLIVSLFNMAIFMLAEFTTIGSLFKDFVGDKAFPIIIVTAVLTTIYSAYGGLLVSIVTDQIQAMTSLLLLTVLSIFVWATFKQPLTPGWGELAPLLGPNDAGYGAILVMPASLMAATVFNEGMWQRVWASQDEQALKQGSIIGCIWVVLAIFLYGLFGYIACWGGLVDYVKTNINLYLFQVLKTDPTEGPNERVDTAIEVIILILALVMCESAIDSLQNGITASLVSAVPKTMMKRLGSSGLLVARLIVVGINVIIVSFALANYNVLSLFLSANMLGCCWAFSLMIGIWWDTPTGRRVFSETTTVLGCCAAIIFVSIYGITDGARQCTEAAAAFSLFPPYPDICQCGTPEQIAAAEAAGVEFGFDLEASKSINCAAAGVTWAWLKHPYMWQHFTIICFTAPAVVTLLGLINLALPEDAPGLTDIFRLNSLRHVEEEEPEPVKNVEMPQMTVVMTPYGPMQVPIQQLASAPFQPPMAPAGMPPGMPFPVSNVHGFA